MKISIDACIPSGFGMGAAGAGGLRCGIAMELETAQSFSAKSATASDIRYAVRNDAQRGEFLILWKSKTCFVQAAGDAEPFFVEYYEDESDLALQCQTVLSADELEQLLLKYLSDDPDWHAGYEWMPEPERPWWKFW